MFHWQKHASLVFLLIHVMYRFTLVYTPGRLGKPHPSPQDTTPEMQTSLSSMFLVSVQRTPKPIMRYHALIYSWIHASIHSFILFWWMIIGKIARICLNNLYWNNDLSYLLATKVYKPIFSFINVELFASVAPLCNHIMNYTVATQRNGGGYGSILYYRNR